MPSTEPIVPAYAAEILGMLSRVLRVFIELDEVTKVGLGCAPGDDMLPRPFLGNVVSKLWAAEYCAP